MKRALLALLLVASPAFAQATNGWAEIQNGWGEIQTPPGSTTIPPPASATLGCVGIFLGSPLNLQCAPASGLVYATTTKSLDVTDGRVQAGNVKAIPLPAAGSITVTPQGTTGATTYTYSLQACYADGTCNAAGPASTTAAGVATLSATNFNRLTWSAVPGAASYKIRRDVGGATQGVIWSGTALTVDDTGLAGDGSAKPTHNETGRVSSTSVVTSRVSDAYAGVSGRVAYQPGLAASPSPGFGLSRIGSWAAYDAGATGGLVTKRYWGGVFDGRYVYFAPGGGGTIGGQHGSFLRYDTLGEFDAADSWASYDASSTDGLGTIGYAGGTFDGRYVYFAPWENDVPATHGNVLRLDTQGSFTDAASWAAYDASGTGSLDCRGYRDAIFDGQRYVYFVPLRTSADAADYHARVLRYDTQGGGFAAAGSWTVYDAGATSALVSKGYKSAVSDGRYIYFVPNNTNGSGTQTAVHLRFDTAGAFDAGGSWSAVSTAATDGLTTKGYSSAVFDGRYVYFVPVSDSSTYHGRLLRYDTHGAWTAGQFQSFDMGTVGGANSRGYIGAVYDGARYIYFVPYYQGIEGGTGNYHGTWTRYDTTKNFYLAASYEIFDASSTSGLTCEGYAGAVFDGRFIYAVPHKNDVGEHGYALRFDTGRPAPPMPTAYTIKWNGPTLASALPATITQAGAYWELGTTTYAQTGFARGGTYTAPLSRSTGPKWTTLTAETPTTFATLALNASSVATADLQVLVQANDATEYQGMGYRVRVNTRRNATGDTVSTVGIVDDSATLPAVAGSGTLTCTFSVVEGASSVAIQATCTSSLTETTLRAMADIVSIGANATVRLP